MARRPLFLPRYVFAAAARDSHVAASLRDPDGARSGETRRRWPPAPRASNQGQLRGSPGQDQGHVCGQSAPITQTHPDAAGCQCLQGGDDTRAAAPILAPRPSGPAIAAVPWRSVQPRRTAGDRAAYTPGHETPAIVVHRSSYLDRKAE